MRCLRRRAGLRPLLRRRGRTLHRLRCPHPLGKQTCRKLKHCRFSLQLRSRHGAGIESISL
ncbi:hypothetical protein KSP39_PZI004712 [Platanthera zijinensis]|uniref:Uncharacterized protein n=1 Tax=Platanthera zijinensis TaxID=2320716 RepID=A0AAP0BWJ3_9ASPA